MGQNKGCIAALFYGLSLLIVFAAAGSLGCSEQEGSQSDASTQGTGSVNMTLKVFEGMMGRKLLSERIRPIKVANEAEWESDSSDRSIGHTWSGYRGFRLEYHWPADVLKGEAPIVPGVYVKSESPPERSWAYEISQAGGQPTWVVLEKGIVIHVFDVDDAAGNGRDQALESAQSWLDRRVAAGIAQYVQKVR